eukprot:4059285-Prymnesium_polylepis.1
MSTGIGNGCNPKRGEVTGELGTNRACRCRAVARTRITRVGRPPSWQLWPHLNKRAGRRRAT